MSGRVKARGRPGDLHVAGAELVDSAKGKAGSKVGWQQGRQRPSAEEGKGAGSSRDTWTVGCRGGNGHPDDASAADDVFGGAVDQSCLVIKVIGRTAR